MLLDGVVGKAASMKVTDFETFIGLMENIDDSIATVGSKASRGFEIQRNRLLSRFSQKPISQPETGNTN